MNLLKFYGQLVYDELYDELVHECDMKGIKELTLSIEEFDGHVCKKVDRFGDKGNGIGE